MTIEVKHEVHVYLHLGLTLQTQLDRIEGKLDDLAKADQQTEANVMAGIDAVRAAVERETTVQGGMVTMMNGLADEIRKRANDEQALLQLADQLNANSDAMASAQAANTGLVTPAGSGASTGGAGTTAGAGGAATTTGGTATTDTTGTTGGAVGGTTGTTTGTGATPAGTDTTGGGTAGSTGGTEPGTIPINPV